MSNDKIIKRLKKNGPVDLKDPIDRIGLIGDLGRIRGVKRENVITAIDIVSRKKDTVINTDKERQELALMITRQANRNRERIPLARAFTASKNMIRSRNWKFQPSQGKGWRTFDRTWKGALVADSRTKKGAENLAKFLRKNNVGKVRVVPYGSGKKTHYSVYSQNNVQVANKRNLKSAMKRMNDKQLKETNMMLKSASDLKQGKRNRNVPLLTTKKNIPKLGLKFKRRY
jgi:hypothetical protein